MAKKNYDSSSCTRFATRKERDNMIIDDGKRKSIVMEDGDSIFIFKRNGTVATVLPGPAEALRCPDNRGFPFACALLEILRTPETADKVFGPVLRKLASEIDESIMLAGSPSKETN